MLGLFDLFGRSAAAKALDRALREAGLHPVLVPEAVKITIVRLLKKEEDARGSARPADRDDAVQLLAYCMLGREPFIESNDTADADRAEYRLEAAIAAGDSLDARIVLLALHAGLVSAEIADRIDAEDA